MMITQFYGMPEKLVSHHDTFKILIKITQFHCLFWWNIFTAQSIL